MTRLIVLNGPPGIGKSTLASRFVDDHPLTLSLEQDLVRGLIGGWRSREHDSGRLARLLCVGMARTHLESGHDVIVPQFIAMASYLDELSDLAVDVGAHFVELVLLDSADACERRFHARLRDPDPVLAEHQRVAAAFIEEADGYPLHYRRLVTCLRGREALTILSGEGECQSTYALLTAALEAGETS